MKRIAAALAGCLLCAALLGCGAGKNAGSKFGSTMNQIMEGSGYSLSEAEPENDTQMRWMLLENGEETGVTVTADWAKGKGLSEIVIVTVDYDNRMVPYLETCIYAIRASSEKLVDDDDAARAVLDNTIISEEITAAGRTRYVSDGITYEYDFLQAGPLISRDSSRYSIALPQ